MSTGAARLILCLTLGRPCLRLSVYFQGTMNGLIVPDDSSEAAGGEKTADRSKKIVRLRLPDELFSVRLAVITQ